MDRSDGVSISRRTLVSALSAGGVGFIAGCLDGESDDGGESNNGEGESNDESGSEAEAGDLELLDHPEDEPAEIPRDYECPVCGMNPREYPDWNAQLAHEGDGGTAFDSAGCLVSYYADPEAYGGPDSEIVGVWATDFETHETIDATDASFVLEDDQNRNDDPMHSPVPFADSADAEAYVEEYDDLSTEDIVDLDATSDHADMYPH